MAQRDDLFQKFGPMLLEAVMHVLLEELNHLRNEQGMPEITIEALTASLENHLSDLPPYDWPHKPPFPQE